jgi:hypothetical protein
MGHGSDLDAVQPGGSTSASDRRWRSSIRPVLRKRHQKRIMIADGL